jgi:hypothetical protein
MTGTGGSSSRHCDTIWSVAQTCRLAIRRSAREVGGVSPAAGGAAREAGGVSPAAGGAAREAGGVSPAAGWGLRQC